MPGPSKVLDVGPGMGSGSEIFDAVELNASLARLSGPYDFIYSFYAFGFHWSLEHFLDELLSLMHERSVCAFTLHERFADFDKFAGLNYRVVNLRGSWPQGQWTRLLVTSRDNDLLSTLTLAWPFLRPLGLRRSVARPAARLPWPILDLHR